MPNPPSITPIDIGRIRAISLDLDDTLWPVWPAIERAERVLHEWLQASAPATARLYGDAAALRVIRLAVQTERPDLHHDLSEMRRESIRRALAHAGDDPALASTAFEVFFAQRQRVDFYADALGSLERLATRWPLVALSNGNADVHQVGIGHLFRAKIAAQGRGFAKPDVRMFQAAADAVEVPMSAVLHVGDDVAMDVVGALDAGLQAVWVNRTGAAWPHSRKPQLEVSDLGLLCNALVPGN